MSTVLNRLNLTDLKIKDGDLGLDYDPITLSYNCQTLLGETEIRASIKRAILTSPLSYQRWVRDNLEVKIQDVEYGNVGYTLLSQPTINVLSRIESTIKDALKHEDRITILKVTLSSNSEKVSIVLDYKLKDSRELELVING